MIACPLRGRNKTTLDPSRLIEVPHYCQYWYCYFVCYFCCYLLSCCNLLPVLRLLQRVLLLVLCFFLLLILLTIRVWNTTQCHRCCSFAVVVLMICFSLFVQAATISCCHCQSCISRCTSMPPGIRSLRVVNLPVLLLLLFPLVISGQ